MAGVTDDERIARLIELAQKVWPSAGEVGLSDLNPGEVILAKYLPEWTPLLTLQCDHPRALDALEAALLVLAGDTVVNALIARSSLGAGLHAMQTDPEAELERIDAELTNEVMDAIRDANTMPPAWVEALASDWESSYRMLRENYPEHAGLTLIAHCLRDLAAELRKRAKEG